MIAAFESLLPVFLLMLAGVAFRRGNIIGEDLWRGVETLSYWLFFPALLAETMIRADLQSIEVTGLVVVMLSAFAVLTLALLLLRHQWCRALAITMPAFTSVFQASLRWNGFIALPIAAKLYGQDGVTLVAVVLAVLVPTANIVNVMVLATLASRQKPSPLRVLWLTGRNPFIWSTAIGLMINLLAIPVYDPLMTTMHLLGGAAIACGLLLVGAGLMLEQALRPSRAVVAATVLKVIAMPALVIAIALPVGLTGTALVVAVICGAVPTAMNGYLLARQMGGDAPLYAAASTCQTVLSALSIPFFVWFAQRLAG